MRRATTNIFSYISKCYAGNIHQNETLRDEKKCKQSHLKVLTVYLSCLPDFPVKKNFLYIFLSLNHDLFRKK